MPASGFLVGDGAEDDVTAQGRGSGRRRDRRPFGRVCGAARRRMTCTSIATMLFMSRARGPRRIRRQIRANGRGSSRPAPRARRPGAREARAGHRRYRRRGRGKRSSHGRGTAPRPWDRGPRLPAPAPGNEPRGSRRGRVDALDPDECAEQLSQLRQARSRRALPRPSLLRQTLATSAAPNHVFSLSSGRDPPPTSPSSTSPGVRPGGRPW